MQNTRISTSHFVFANGGGDLIRAARRSWTASRSFTRSLAGQGCFRHPADHDRRARCLRAFPSPARRSIPMTRTSPARIMAGAATGRARPRIRNRSGTVGKMQTWAGICADRRFAEAEPGCREVPITLRTGRSPPLARRGIWPAAARRRHGEQPGLRGRGADRPRRLLRLGALHWSGNGGGRRRTDRLHRRNSCPVGGWPVAYRRRLVHRRLAGYQDSRLTACADPARAPLPARSSRRRSAPGVCRAASAAAMTGSIPNITSLRATGGGRLARDRTVRAGMGGSPVGGPMKPPI